MFVSGNTTDEEAKAPPRIQQQLSKEAGPQRRSSSSRQLSSQQSRQQELSQQAAEPQHQIVLTPVQMKLQQQLQSRHNELARRIAEQQEELKRLGNELRMVGVVPVQPAITAAGESASHLYKDMNQTLALLLTKRDGYRNDGDQFNLFWYL